MSPEAGTGGFTVTQFVIRGGKKLQGEVEISGAKNAAVAILPAAFLVDGECRIENIPQISDVTLLLESMADMGADIRTVNRTTMDICCRGLSYREPGDAMGEIRASYYFIGALLGRFGQARVPMPGGCDIGVRPIDQHLKGMRAMGADIRGAGTSVIRVFGTDRLRGGSYTIIPDQIEAGTYLAAAAAAGGDVLVKGVIPKHLFSITAKLEEMGCEILDMGDMVRIRSEGRLHTANVKTMPYPGFPTDMQPQIVTCLARADGTSVVTEDVWDNRFKYVTELAKMGAKIQVDGKVAVIEGVERLTGATVKACDLRAGAAMVIAGLAAEGVTRITEIHHIQRGYEDLVQKLRGLGADICEEETAEESETSKNLA